MLLAESNHNNSYEMVSAHVCAVEFQLMEPDMDIIWRNGQPYSSQFNDVYFSTEDGVAETEYVFLQGNQLIERWRNLGAHQFTIIETGFGTGLNFLVTAYTWLKYAPPNTVLHFNSIEKFPLTQKQIAEAQCLWPMFAEIAEAFQAQYAQCKPGKNTFDIMHQRVKFTLWLEDVTSALPHISEQADAWFLDGFAPAKNPEMWQDDLFHQMARLSHQRTTFATFTSAGLVRRGLINAGFIVSKRTGFGQKREMLYGMYSPKTSATVDTISAPSSIKTAIVIGAGIAGCATAFALAERGVQVILLEQHNAVAQEASGNAVGVLYPRLIGHDTQSEFSLASFLWTVQWLDTLQNNGILSPEVIKRCGMLQLAHTARELARFQALAGGHQHDVLARLVTAQEACDIAQAEIYHAALHIPSAFAIQPSQVCQQLSQHPKITVLLQHTAADIHQHQEAWQVTLTNGDALCADAVVIANACAARRLSVSAHLPIQSVRGQITQLSSTTQSQKLRCILCSDGYISPAFDNQHILGATFVPCDDNIDVRKQEDVSNLQMLALMSPALHHDLFDRHRSSRAAIRCASPDHMPLAGPLIDTQSLMSAPPRYNASTDSLPWLKGLYLNIGHGSKGLTTAPYCAMLIAETITGATRTMDNRFIVALNPNRFTLKSMGLKQLIRTSVIR